MIAAMSDSDELHEINRRIELLRENLRRLVQQAAAYAGAADEARISERIADVCQAGWSSRGARDNGEIGFFSTMRHRASRRLKAKFNAKGDAGN
jgi:hypothetical protein